MTYFYFFAAYLVGIMVTIIHVQAELHLQAGMLLLFGSVFPWFGEPE